MMGIRRVPDNTKTKEGCGPLPDYQAIKFNTQDEDKNKGIPEDKYTADVFVWDEDGTLLTERLTLKNSTDYEGDDKNIIIGKYDTVKVVKKWQKIFFLSTGNFGPTFTAAEIRVIRSESNNAKPTISKKAKF